MDINVVQLLFSGLTVGAVYAVTALGFTVVYNATGVVNFAQGEFLMLGAMLAATGVLHGVPLPFAVVLAVGAVVVIGVAMDVLMIAPLGRSHLVATVIMTIAASIVFKGVALLAFGANARPLPAFSGEASLWLFGAAISPQGLWVVGTVLALLVLFWLVFRGTMLGWSLLAVSDHSEAAALMGISVRYATALAYAVSAGSGAIAGIVVAPITFATWDMGTMLGVKAFSACVLGGMGNPVGAVVGAVALGVVEAFAAGFVSTGLRDAFSFGILLAVLVLRPSGLFVAAAR
ncbi:MAG: branched-chain amino acid ABC transporter permease [Candidatus Rokubacteria bacterium]|nr:branched-chain amino acid ABC transporter permease [Candidatus Rokubacteria bacterium]